ncbi:MAG: hypothetical protein KAI24_02280, partial [Planctomycetes bacterium]|nr:hypothetical protein [Planctomycetota bacterium]
VQVLGKLRRPASIDALLQMLREQSADTATGAATDVQAALLTLADLGASEHLLRMAAAIGDGDAGGCGEALTYAFQTLSPKLDGDRENTVLVAVLDHREPLLRRYAITRLAELARPTAIAALEGRLGKEDAELRPLVEVALAQLRNEGSVQPTDELERATNNAKVLGARALTWWNGLGTAEQAMFGSIPVALILALWLLRRASRRRAHEHDALAAAALVAPSDEYLEEHEYDEYDEHAEYDDEGEYDDGEYEGEYEDEDGEYEDEEYADGEYDEELDEEQYDTSGWEDDEATVATDGSALEDERFQ